MSITKISPRMQKALDDGKPLRFFADLFLDTLNESIDSEEDFLSSPSQSNMDFTAYPGFASLALVDHTIEQTMHDSEMQVNTEYGDGLVSLSTPFQSFVLYQNVVISGVTLWVKNTTGAAVDYAASLLTPALKSANEQADRRWTYSWLSHDNFVPRHPPAIATTIVSVPNGTDGEVFFPFNNLLLVPGTYYILPHWGIVNGAASSNFTIGYSAADTYADGCRGRYWLTSDLAVYGHAQFFVDNDMGGDLYFKVHYQGFAASGSFTTKRMSLPSLPPAPGNFQLSSQVPLECSLDVTLNAYTNETDTTPAATYENITDGAAIAPYLHWDAYVVMRSTGYFDRTPLLDMLEVLFPSRRLRFREKETPLISAESDLQDFAPALLPITLQASELKIVERVASGGNVAITIEDENADIIRQIVSDSPLKNYRCELFVGADVPGLCTSDLCSFFLGVVDSASVKPRFRRGTYSATLNVKNTLMDLKRKAPLPQTTGVVDFADIGISYDGDHVADAMLDMVRAQAGIPSRYVNMDSFASAKESIGPTFMVYRANAAGLTDTRIKSPQEVVKFLTPLAVIADGYLVPDEQSRITFIRHNAAATPEATWADETLVRAGYNAIPIEDISDILMGYDDLLFNLVVMGSGWDGEGDDWSAFDDIYATLDEDSADAFAMGNAIFINPMEKNLVEASKWLGPESGYSGETIARTLTARYAARYAYPPVRLKGCVLPISQFMRNVGSVVQIVSDEICKFGMSRIPASETVKFMITSKKYDRNKNRMVFDLMELT